MLITIDSDSGKKTFNPDEGRVISIPLNFNGPQPSAYGVGLAESHPLKAGDFVGSVELGGSANCNEIRLIPHCQGTHTESIEHILTDKVPVTDVLGTSLLHEARLITVSLEEVGGDGDRVIPLTSLKEALFGRSIPQTLVIRTLPNDDSKLTRNYSENPPPYFTEEAMRFIVEIGVIHLIVDIPSVDKAWDGGKLSNHRIYWNVGSGIRELKGGERLNATITEMVYVPEAIKDGEYIVAIQIPPFMSDAANSKVVMYPVG